MEYSIRDTGITKVQLLAFMDFSFSSCSMQMVEIGMQMHLSCGVHDMIDHTSTTTFFIFSGDEKL